MENRLNLIWKAVTWSKMDFIKEEWRERQRKAGFLNWSDKDLDSFWYLCDAIGHSSAYNSPRMTELRNKYEKDLFLQYNLDYDCDKNCFMS